MTRFKVEDMTCGGCAASITRAVQRVDPAAKVEVDLAGHMVDVQSSAADAGKIEATIREAGFTPQPA
jgi:copper chaperone